MAVNAAIAAWYYLRLIALMFLDAAAQPEAALNRVSWTSWIAGVACTLATVWFFMAPQSIWDSLP
jgi:NADH:ubiquinone oxidoreductase subunit 2 (subunit N)